RLYEEEQVLDVMEELDRERDGPPSAVQDATESGPQRPQPDKHHDRVAVVQRFRLNQPREEVTNQSACFRYRPAQPVNLERLQQVLAPMGQYDHHEEPQRDFMLGSVKAIHEGRIVAIARSVGN